MIRITVAGVDDKALTRLAARIRGAVLERSAALDADAALFVHPSRAEIDEIAGLLAQGRTVLATTGLWLDADVLERLRLSAERGRGRFIPANLERFVPSRQLIRQHVEAGKLGTPGLIRAHRWQFVSHSKMDRTALLANDVDVTLWLMGKRPEIAFAVATMGPESLSHLRFLQAHLGFGGGAMALLDWADLPAGDDYSSLSLIGSTGAAYADDQRNVQLQFHGTQMRGVKVDERGPALWSLIQSFVDALEDGSPPEMADWGTTLMVLETLRKSVETREAVAVKGGAA